MEYRNVKVPVWAYENGRRLYGEIVRNGINYVPQQIRNPSLCPYCGAPVRYVEVKYRYAECPNCFYRQQTFGVETNIGEAIAAVGLGTLFGLAIAALAEALPEKGREGRG